MAKPEWGTKRVCQSCSTIYYDFKKNPPACPSCGTKFDPEALLKSRRGRTLPDEPAHEETVKKPTDELEALEDTELDDADLLAADDDEDEDALIEDASELGEDDDDVGVDVDVDTSDDR